MKKRFFISILSVLLLVALIWGSLFALNCRSFVPETANTATLDVNAPVEVGNTITAQTGVWIPWFSKVAVEEINAGKYAVASGTASTETASYGIFLKKDTISVKLAAVEPGITEDANFAFTIKTPGKAIEKYVCQIPKFQISEPSGKNNPSLLLADKEFAPKEKMFWKYAIAILSVLAAGAVILGAVYYFKIRRQSRQLSEWEKAKRDLELLYSDIEHKRITPLGGFIRLTDLVRGYLEKRFGLPATKNTTQEFLDNISGTADIKIPADSKPFLKNFLTAADQVKFAKAAADTSLLKKALADASNLIASTCPVEEDKNV